MKRTLIALALLIGTPAAASTILPNTYAAKFCELRAIGVSKDEAITAAIREATVSRDDWTYVTVNGKRYQSDVIFAATAVAKLCPQFL